MASELSGAIGRRMLVAKAQGQLDQEYLSALELIRPEIDLALAEVREVLDGLQTFWIDEGDDVPVEWHWCDPDADCNDNCQRARALYEKLAVK